MGVRAMDDEEPIGFVGRCAQEVPRSVSTRGKINPSRYLDTSGSGVWTTVGNSKFGNRDYGTSVMYDEGKVLIVGGGGLSTTGSPPTRTAEVIDLVANPVWRYTTSMAFARRQHNATLLPDGKVLVTGGTRLPGFNNGAGAVLTAEIWDPATEAWTTLASMRVPRLYHSTALLLPDARVLAAGGGFPPAQTTLPPDTDHLDGETGSGSLPRRTRSTRTSGSIACPSRWRRTAWTSKRRPAAIWRRPVTTCCSCSTGTGAVSSLDHPTRLRPFQTHPPTSDPATARPPPVLTARRRRARA